MQLDPRFSIYTPSEPKEAQLQDYKPISFTGCGDEDKELRIYTPYLLANNQEVFQQFFNTCLLR